MSGERRSRAVQEVVVGRVWRWKVVEETYSGHLTIHVCVCMCMHVCVYMLI